MVYLGESLEFTNPVFVVSICLQNFESASSDLLTAYQFGRLKNDTECPFAEDRLEFKSIIYDRSEQSLWI